MKSSASDALTIELLSRSPRVQDDWIDSLPAWRERVHPGISLVDALIIAGVLHTPAARIVELVAAGTIRAENLPVLITALGSARLQAALVAPAAAPEPPAVEGFDAFAAGEFIPLDAMGSESVEEDNSKSREYDAYDPGAFISFDAPEVAEDDEETESVSPQKKASYDQYEAGEFITFDDGDA